MAGHQAVLVVTRRDRWARVSTSAGFAVQGLSFASVISQVFFIRGNEMIGANRAGVFINLVPIIGSLLSVLILGEAFQLYHGLALVLVLGGIWLAEHSGRAMARPENEKPAG